MTNLAKSEAIVSDTITALRFPLIAAVVFIHTFIVGQPDIDGRINVQSGQFPFYDMLDYTVRICFAEIAVPLFFAIAGYLFFYKCDFNQSVYKKKIKSRLRTLLVPYILWNLLYLLYILATQLIMPSATSHGRKLILDYTLLDFFDSFWHFDGIYRGWGPIYAPLWFIRDLIEINLFAPLIYWIVKEKRIVGITVLFTLYLCGLWLITPGVCITGFSFYAMGAWASVNRIDLLRMVSIRGMLVMIVSFAFLIMDILLWKHGIFHPFFHRCFIVSGVIAFVALSLSLVLKYGIGDICVYLSRCSFFVYLFHLFVIPIFNKCWASVLSPINTFTASLALFLVPLVTCIVCIGLYECMKGVLPSVMSVLVGGR